MKRNEKNRNERAPRPAVIVQQEPDQRRVHDLLEKELRQALEALANDDGGEVAA